MLLKDLFKFSIGLRLMDGALSFGQTDGGDCVPNADTALPAEAGIKDLTSFFAVPLLVNSL